MNLPLRREQGLYIRVGEKIGSAVRAVVVAVVLVVLAVGQAGVVWNIEQGLSLTPVAIADAQKKRTALWQRVRAFMETRDLLILPTVAVPPFPVEQRHPTEINGRPLADYTQWFFLTYGITVTGLPAISVPCGFTRAGLPVGLQIVGKRHGEAAVLRAAAAFEAAAPWAGRVPPTVPAA